MLTETASRLRDWALFAAAALLPALALGGLGLRALGSEEAAIEREAKLALEATADRVIREIESALPEAAARAASAPQRLDELAPPFATPLALESDRGLPASPRDRERHPPTDARCSAMLAALATTREPSARAAQRRALLSQCEGARAPSGRFVYPLVAVEGLAPEEGPALVAWLEANAARLSSAERAALALDLAPLPLSAPLRARADALLHAADAQPVELAALLREPEVAAALRAPTGPGGAIDWRAASSIGALRAAPGGRFVGYVVHRGSLEIALGRGFPKVAPEQRVALGADRARAHELVATRALSPALVLAASYADPLFLAKRTTRSRRVLAAVALSATASAFVIAALLFARVRAARRASELRTDFVAAVSHELRTPIASVRMFAELLEEGRVEDDERAEVYAALGGEARRLSTTVDRLLGFARLASGKRPLDRALQSVSAVVEESLRVFEERHREHRLTRALAPDAEAFVDAAEVRLAVDNLLANARKYAPDGAPYEVRVTREGAGVAIAIADHGPGIARRDQARIFEPFERADDRLSRATEGSGIGLSLVRNVARAHGGEARVESEPGHGATFTIWLPRGTTA